MIPGSDIHKNRIYLQAYVQKLKIKEEIERKSKELPELKIRSNGPIPRTKEHKYDHSQGYLMGAPASLPQKIEDEWWRRAPSIAGEDSAEVHKRLSDVSSYTGLYRHRFTSKDGPLAITGDYLDQPLKAIRLLKNTSSSMLTIPGRAADFCTEVNWRMSLRPQFN